MIISEEQLLKDPSTSFWLKEQIVALNNRDPIDSLHDAEVLLELQKQKVATLEKNISEYHEKGTAL